MAVLPKTYEYKIYRDGTYLGSLPNVISDFKYSQQINTAGAQLEVELQIDPDTTDETIEAIQAETGDTITDESGIDLLIERQPDIFGNSASNILLREENDIIVWMFNDNYPNGKQVFQGYITTWKANFGTSNTIHIVVINYGTELDNYIITEGN